MKTTLEFGQLKIHEYVNEEKLEQNDWFSFKYVAGSSSERRKVQFLSVEPKFSADGIPSDVIYHVREYEGDNAGISKKWYYAL